MRAMTFERLVHSDRFVSELLTKTIGQLGLPRPKGVRRRDCHGTVATTALELAQAHLKANFAGEATMLTALAVPYLRLENVAGATAIQPDFAVVCPREVSGMSIGSWLIMGDAKDYERIRSRIDDGRMLKGFLQVALGAESAQAWSKLPSGMHVHRSGALAVPRNAFLQPEAVVELLDDHRSEVRSRADERLAAKTKLGDAAPAEADLPTYVAHLEATFDPKSCVTCSLFFYCRDGLRASVNPLAVLTEIGIERLTRGAVSGLVTGVGDTGRAPHSIIAQVTATVSGLPQWTDLLRVDPCGLPGTINVVLIKSDAAALGIHGLGVQTVGVDGPGTWQQAAFLDPQSPLTRRSAMRMIGTAVRALHISGLSPIHIIVADGATADLLVTAADSLAGVELSRLRWQHDVDSGRPALTFDGEAAMIPDALDEDERLAISFLLEGDRARALTLRTPIVDLRSVVASHVIPGGPAVDAGRLDYLVTWAEATEPLDHRAVSDEIAGLTDTPGARLSNAASDAIHSARRVDNQQKYNALVHAALAYRVRIMKRALDVLAQRRSSRLRVVHRTLEADAQAVWGRRLALQASDLVRFSRTYPIWRNSHVDLLDADRKCQLQLTCLADRSYARDKATDAGVREVALAVVVGIDPIRLDIRSRRLVSGSRIVALHINDRGMLEEVTTTIKIQAGSFKIGEMAVGLLSEPADGDGLVWLPSVAPSVTVGDELVIADAAWFGKPFKSGHEIAIGRPSLDDQSAPKTTCTPDTYAADPIGHQWCCRPHRVSEAEWSDTIAQRRARGELNPDVWPPLVDEERFDIGHVDAPEVPNTNVPDGLTIDDLD
ncbi:MAG: hypothetical protein JWM93_1175 [Frankiales bacterium]|nr:hypothetical protein [Frankiales bacterium]